MPQDLQAQINNNFQKINDKIGALFGAYKDKIDPSFHDLFTSHQAQNTAQSTPAVVAPELGTANQVWNALPEQSGIKVITKSVQQRSFKPLTESLGSVAKSLQSPEGIMGFVNPDLEAQPLTTKFLEYAKNKINLSRQEILDFARRPELKKGEADLLNTLAKDLPSGKIPAQEFADSVRQELLPLKAVEVKEPQYQPISIEHSGAGGYYPGKKYLGKNYEEVVFESPITTNSSSHYPNSQNYFAHARGDEVIEDGKKIWREQEIQSDALQKDELERLYRANNAPPPNYADVNEEKIRQVERQKDLEKLQPFTNDRFGERIMRERIKQKAQQGYSSYRFPTGETIGKIEGFQAGGERWGIVNPKTGGLSTIESGERSLTPDKLKVGLEVGQQTGATSFDKWIITDILGDGRFKAVQKRDLDENVIQRLKSGEVSQKLKENLDYQSETFDLTGKSNPQYSRYEKWGKFLKNKYGGKEITDPQGNTWVEAPLKKEYAKMPIEAFGVVPFLQQMVQGYKQRERQTAETSNPQ